VIFARKESAALNRVNVAANRCHAGLPLPLADGQRGGSAGALMSPRERRQLRPTFVRVTTHVASPTGQNERKIQAKAIGAGH
jgi:hypothetical protein